MIVHERCKECDGRLYRLRPLDAGALWVCAGGHGWIHLVFSRRPGDEEWIAAPALALAFERPVEAVPA